MGLLELNRGLECARVLVRISPLRFAFNAVNDLVEDGRAERGGVLRADEGRKLFLRAVGLANVAHGFGLRETAPKECGLLFQVRNVRPERVETGAGLKKSFFIHRVIPSKKRYVR